MSAPTFTPGPWTLTHRAGSNFAVQSFEIRGMFGDKPNICPIFNRSRDAIDCTLVHVSPGDARLIAAAPDLYEACKWAEAALAPFSKEPAERSGISMLRAALAKARGGQ